MSEQMLIEIIKSAGLIIAAGVPSLAALTISRSRRTKEKLEKDLKVALKDIRFLLNVEAEHGKRSKEETGKSNLLLVRKTVHAEKHLSWSGKNSESKVLKRLEEME